MRIGIDKKTAVAVALFAAAAVASAATPPVVAAAIAGFFADKNESAALYAQTTNRIAKQYAIDLEALKKKYQGEGSLDGYLAVQKEAERFASASTESRGFYAEIPEMPASCIVYQPALLRKMQIAYMSSVRDARRQDRTRIDAAADKMLGRIENVQKELTKRGQIDDAIAIKGISDKVKEALSRGTIEEYARSLAADVATAPKQGAQPAQPVRPQGDASATAPEPRQPRRAASASGWKKWQYVGEQPFSPDLKGFFGQGLTSPVSAKTSEFIGKTTFLAARGLQQAQQVGGALCEWSGTAIQWNIPDPAQLPVKMKVTSNILASDGNHGPKLFISVVGGEPMIQTMPVELMQQECELKIVQDSRDSTSFAIFWPNARRSARFTVAPGTPVKLFVGVALNGARQSCDTVVQFLQ